VHSVKKIFLAFAISISATSLLANPLSDKISDEVLDSMIASHDKFINSNILAEICSHPNYLKPDYSSSLLQQQIVNEVHTVASQRGVKNYDVTQIRELTELEFQAFIDGSRYGVFIAAKYQKTMGLSECSAEIKKSISDSQSSLLESGLYQLVNRK
jgi:hypothetical protein